MKTLWASPPREQDVSMLKNAISERFLQSLVQP